MPSMGGQGVAIPVEIRTRAADFAREWADETYEKGWRFLLKLKASAQAYLALRLAASTC